MELYRLSVLGLQPMRSGYFRALEILPFLVLGALWKQGDLTWANGATAMIAVAGLYAATPWILQIQRPRWKAELTRKLARLEALIAQETDPVKRQWLRRQADELPLRYHLAEDPEPTYAKCRALARLAYGAHKFASGVSKN